MATSNHDFDDIIIHTNIILTFVKIIIAILLFLGIWVQFQSKYPAQCGAPIPWCGTPDRLGSRNTVGKSLFINNCAQCHAKDMKTKLTGPALGGTKERWAKYPRTDLYQFIRYSQKMVKKGHPRAKQLWSEWKPTVMPPFTHLSDEDIENILDYIGS